MSDGNDFNERNIAEFRANHGRVGGNFEGAPLVVLHTAGARSGQPRTNIMMYRPDGDRYLIFASYAGADKNPAWYWNLKANPDARIEVGDDIVDVHATELEGAERDEVHTAYVTMAEVGRVTDQQRHTFFTVGRRLCQERGAEAIMLGGTDMFLAFVGQQSPFPLIDCADIHVDAIYRKSSAAD